MLFAANLPGTDWQVNPALSLEEQSGGVKYASDRGFSSTYAKGELELQLKGTRIESDAVAKQMSVVEFANLEKLYAARGNPYEGQITEFVECDKVYKPQTFEFEFAGQKRRGLLAAANERKLFGACARPQVAYWVSYFNFYDPSAKLMIEARLFHGAAHPDARKVAELSKKLEKITRELLVKNLGEKVR